MIDIERAWAKSQELSSENSFCSDIAYAKEKFWKVAKRMQEESKVHAMIAEIKIMRAQGPLELIKSRNEFFEKTVDEQIRKVRSFLSRFDLPENELCLPESNSSNEKALIRRCVIRILPAKYFDRQSSKEENWSGFHKTRSVIFGPQNPDLKPGIPNLKLISEIINIKPLKDTQNIPSTLSHELIHQIFLIQHVFSINYFNNAILNLSIDEGPVEFLTQIISELESDVHESSYNNEVSLINHLVTETSKKVGIIEAIRQLILWGYKGGTQNSFVLLCKEIESESFPTGFDCYDISDEAIASLNNFLEKNNYGQADLTHFVEAIKNQTTPHQIPVS